VALILLTAGVGAFLGTALLTTRLVADGRETTRAKQAASERLELLRGITQAPPLYCAGLSDGTDSTPDGMRVAWQVRPLGQLTEVTVIVAPRARPVHGVDSLTALFRCP